MTAVMIASATRIYGHNFEAHRKKTAPARKALENSQAPPDIDENDNENNKGSESEALVRKSSGKSRATSNTDKDDKEYDQDSEESGDSDEFKENDRADDENDFEESDVEMDDNELLNDVSLSILKSTIGYLPILLACHHYASRKERQFIKVGTC